MWMMTSTPYALKHSASAAAAIAMANGVTRGNNIITVNIIIFVFPIKNI